MSASATRLIYFMAVGAMSAALAWLMVADAATAHYRETAPELALRWRPADPGALQTLAQRALRDRQPTRARDYALRALAALPHDGSTWRLLGQATLAAGDEAGARRLFAQAGRLTQRDVALASIFFEDAVRERRWADAVTQAAIIMRRSPRNRDGIVFRLAVLAREPAMARALAPAIAREPEWQNAFLRELTSNDVHLPAAIQVLTALTREAPNYRPKGLPRVFTQMTRQGHGVRARELWAARLAPSQRPAPDQIYDPDFRDAEAGPPFGWHGARPGVTVGDGLRLDLDRPDSGRLIRQQLVLPPGRYRLESAGRARDGAEARLSWRLDCKGAEPTPLDLSGGPATAVGEIEIGADCPSQLLYLHRSADGPARLRATIDFVRIQRLG